MAVGGYKVIANIQAVLPDLADSIRARWNFSLSSMAYQALVDPGHKAEDDGSGLGEALPDCPPHPNLNLYNKLKNRRQRFVKTPQSAIA